VDNNIGVDLGVSGSGAMNFLVDNNTFTADQYGIQVEQRGAAIMAGAAELACPLSEPKSSGRGGLRRPALHSAGPQQPNNRESPRAIRRGYGCGRRV
jgi:hypothetical protein